MYRMAEMFSTGCLTFNILLSVLLFPQPEVTCVGQADLSGKQYVEVEVKTSDCVS